MTDECSQPVVVDEGQVSNLLEERHVFRVQKQWEEADSIFRKLVAMGVLIDDKKKVWNLGSAPKPVKQPAIQRGNLFVRLATDALYLETCCSNIYELPDLVPCMWRPGAPWAINAMNPRNHQRL